MKVSSTNIAYHPKYKVLMNGRKQFDRPVDAMAEFVDNSIQACMMIKGRKIVCHICVDSNSKPSYFVVCDNGIGMDPLGIAAFATFAYDQQAKKEEAELAGRQHQLLLSKFGVGAKEAGFYLGDRLIVVTRPQGNEVHRFCLDEATLRELDRTDAAFTGSVETIQVDDQSADWLPWDGASPSRCHSTVNGLVVQHLQGVKSGTVMIVRLLPSIADQLRLDSDGFTKLAIQLKDIYHFYLKPDTFRFHDAAIRGEFERMTKDPLSSDDPKPMKVDIKLYVNTFLDNRDPILQQFDLNADSHNSSLGVSDYLDQCQLGEKVSNQFAFDMPVSAIVSSSSTTAGTAPTPEDIKVYACFYYIPFQKDSEQRPQLDSTIVTKIGSNCCIRCYWQNRWIPFASVGDFPIFDAVANRLSKYTISPQWKHRLVGMLFFDWNFHDISNNKLCFHGKISDRMRDAFDGRTTKKICDNFERWLVAQSKKDQEFHFLDVLEGGQQSIFRCLRYNCNKNVLCVGSKVKLPLAIESEESVPIVITGFQPSQSLVLGQTECFGAGHIIYKRLPEKLYDGIDDPHRRFPTHLLHYKHPVEFTIEEEEKLKTAVVPARILFHTYVTKGKDPDKTIQPSQTLEFKWGQKFYKWAVQIELHDRKLVWGVDGDNGAQQHRYSINLVIADANGRKTWTESKLHKFNPNINDDKEESSPIISKAKQYSFSFYDISSRTFNHKNGKFMIIISVLSPGKDKSVILQREIPINIIPQEFDKIVLSEDCNELVTRLGEFLPKLNFKCMDCFDNIFKMNTPLTIELVSDDVKISPSKGTSQIVNTDNTISFDTSTFKLSEPISPDLMNHDSDTLLSKQIQLVAKPSNVGDRSTLNKGVIIPVKVIPGIPMFIRTVDKNPIEIHLDRDNMLHLVLLDKWNNRVGPNGETWTVSFHGGPLALKPKIHPIVQPNGEIRIEQILISNRNEIYSSETIEQKIEIKRNNGLSNKLSSFQLSFPVTIIVHHAPMKLQVHHDRIQYVGESSVDCKFSMECFPMETISDMTYELVDENDVPLSFPSHATFRMTHEWQNKKGKGNKTTSYPDGSIPEFQVPKECGTYDVAIFIVAYGQTHSATVSIIVLPGQPHKWSIRGNGTSLAAGNMEDGLRSLIEGIDVFDIHDNRTDASPVAQHSPMLCIFANSGSEELPLPPLPLIYNHAPCKVGQKHKVDDDSSPPFVLPTPLPANVIHNWNKYLRPGYNIRLQVQSSAHDDIVIESSEICHQTLTAGEPTTLLLSTKKYQWIMPVRDCQIVIHEGQSVNDIMITVQDNCQAKHNLAGYVVKSFKVSHNDAEWYSLPSKTSAEKLLSTAISLPADKLMAAIVAARKTAVETHQSMGSFTLSFDLTLSKGGNSQVIKLPSAYMHFEVLIANNVKELELKLLNEQQQPLLPTASNSIRVPRNSSLPYLAIRLKTEDDIPYVPDSTSVFELSIMEIFTDGQSKKLNSRDYYGDSFIQSEGEETGPWFIWEPKGQSFSTGKLTYDIELKYCELRRGSGLFSSYPKANVKLEVLPGSPAAFSIKQPLKRVLCIADGVGPDMKIIGKDIKVVVTDDQDTPITLDPQYKLGCTLKPLILDDADANGILWAKTSPGGARSFPFIALAGANVNRNIDDGEYNLSFALLDASGNIVMGKNVLSVTFTSDKTFGNQMRQIKLKQQECQTKIDQYEKKLKARKQLETEYKQRCHELGLPCPVSLQAVDQKRHDVQESLKQLEAVKANVAPCLYPQRAIADQMVGTFPQNVKSKRIGQVVDLATISGNNDLTHMLSYACRQNMDTHVVEDYATARQFFDAGLKVIPLNKPPTKKRGRVASESLNLPSIVEVSGNPRYLVELLHLDSDKEYLRSALFYKLLRNAMVIDTFEDAIQYHRTLTNNGTIPPIFYCLDGRVLHSDGAMDPMNHLNDDLLIKFGGHFGDDHRFEELNYAINQCDDLEVIIRQMDDGQVELEQIKSHVVGIQQELDLLMNDENNLKATMNR